ncbi:transposase [Cellulomonas timonensis]|uniref:transposase n=1 Tax=Cellulomonas timonensis TaxID=1689271 RepID=UPI0009ED7139|nr:transposase [Cellulomonas timonensis]
MPGPYPPEFRRRAVDLARSGKQPGAMGASDLGISESCLRRWMAQDDVDTGRREGISTDEQLGQPRGGLGNLRLDRRLLGPSRRHSDFGYRSPNDFEDQHIAATAAAA